MFFCCGGGNSRQNKTREDFVAAAAGFNAGITEDQGRTNRTPDTNGLSKRAERTQAEVPGRVEIADQVQPRSTVIGIRSQAAPTRLDPFDAVKSCDGDQPSSPPKVLDLAPEISEVTRTMSSDRHIPMSPRHDDSSEGDRYDDAVSQRPGWINASGGRNPMGLIGGKDVNGCVRSSWVTRMHKSPAELNSAGGAEASMWDDDRSVRPGWMGETDSVTAESIGPGWTDGTQPRWIDDTESIGLGPLRSAWADEASVAAPQSVRPGWMGDTESDFAESARPDWVSEAESVTAESTIPGWTNEAESVTAESVRPGWINDRESVTAESIRPGWMDDTGSVGYRTRPTGWDDKIESVVAESVRPGWMDVDDTRSQRPEWMNAGAAPSAISQPGWVGEGNSELVSWSNGDKSIRRGPVDDTDEDIDDGNGNYSRSQLPGWIPGKLPPPSTGTRQARLAAKGKTGLASSSNKTDKTTFLGRSEERLIGSPAKTMGGQSSSEDAARPLSELADPQERRGQHKTIKKPPTFEADLAVLGTMQPSDEGGLLGLILDTDEKDAVRRRTEKLRNAERNRRGYSSAPFPAAALRNRKEADDGLRQQPPRQATAEVPAKITTIIRSKTLPTSESNAKTPTVVKNPTMAGKHRPEKRSSTPTGSTHQGEGAIPPSPATGRYGFSLKEPSPSASGKRTGFAERAGPATPGSAAKPPAALGVTASASTFNTASESSFTVVPKSVAATSASSGSKPAAWRGAKGPRDGAGKATATTPPRVPGAQPTLDRPRLVPPRDICRSSPGRLRSSSNGDAMPTGSPLKVGRRSSSPAGGLKVRASSPATTRGTSPVMVRGYSPTQQSSGASVDRGSGSGFGRKPARGNTLFGSVAGGGRSPRGETEMLTTVVRFEGIDSSSAESEESALAFKKRPFNSGESSGRAPQQSPSQRPRAVAEIASEIPPAPVVITVSNAVEKSPGPPKRGGLKTNKSKAPAGGCSSLRTALDRDSRARKSSESSSTSSADSKKQSASTTNSTPRRDNLPVGGVQAPEAAEVVRIVVTRPSKPRSPANVGGAGQAVEASPGRGDVKMWQSRDPRWEASSPSSTNGPQKASGRDRQHADIPLLANKEAEALAMLPSARVVDGGGRAGRGGGGGVEAVRQGGHAVAVMPLSKPILQAGRQRGRPSPKLGTPSQRRTTRQAPRPRLRITPDLPRVEEEGAPTSPVIPSPHRRPDHGTHPTLHDRSVSADAPVVIPAHVRHQDNKKLPRRDSAPDLAERLLTSKVEKAAQTGAPTSPSTLQKSSIPAKDANAVKVTAVKAKAEVEETAVPARPGPVMPLAVVSDELLEVAGPDESWTKKTEEDKAAMPRIGKEELAVKWLEHRPKRTPAAFMLEREDSNRRKGSQRFSRSSSMDDGSIISFGPRAMFSPDRFNATAGALSWGGSMDDSWCDDSVRSFMTSGTRNSSSTSLVSARAPSDRKVVAPQLSKSERRAVELLKIKRADVHFGYRTVGGSERVYKIELNGEMRAAKVIDILGMSKEAQADVLETFDAELLALSRLNTHNIVKVYGASVSPAEIIVVSEFVEGGVLRDLLKNRRMHKHLNDRMRLAIAQDVAAGMKSLYAHGMQHRHLSSSAILLTSDCRAKIIGVGLSMTTAMISFFKAEDYQEEEEADKGLLWASREVLAGAGFSEKSDVYSFGIVLWEIMQTDGSLPYAGLLPSQVVGAKYNGQGPTIPRDCPPTISRLMESCWSNMPAERPSFDKICDTLEAIGLSQGDIDSTKQPPTPNYSNFFEGAMSVP